MKNFLLLIVFALSTACVSTPVNEQPVPFTTLARGSYCDVTKPQDHVIQSQAELNQIWNKLNLAEQNIPALDFNQRTVLAIFMGEQSSGGYAIRIDRIVRTPAEIVVTVRQTVPPKNTPASLAQTQPYILVSIPRTDLPIKFDYKTE
jgi:hypothetical protein